MAVRKYGALAAAIAAAGALLLLLVMVKSTRNVRLFGPNGDDADVGSSSGETSQARGISLRRVGSRAGLSGATIAGVDAFFRRPLPKPKSKSKSKSKPPPKPSTSDHDDTLDNLSNREPPPAPNNVAGPALSRDDDSEEKAGETLSRLTHPNLNAGDRRWTAVPKDSPVIDVPTEGFKQTAGLPRLAAAAHGRISRITIEVADSTPWRLAEGVGEALQVELEIIVEAGNTVTMPTVDPANFGDAGGAAARYVKGNWTTFWRGRSKAAVWRWGNSASLRCGRDSFRVRLATPLTMEAPAGLFSPGHPDRVAEDGAEAFVLTEFVLGGLCEESHSLLSQHATATVLRPLGIFPALMHFVELSFGGATSGVYLFSDLPNTAVLRAHPGAVAIMQRDGWAGRQKTQFSANYVAVLRDGEVVDSSINPRHSVDALRQQSTSVMNMVYELCKCHAEDSDGGEALLDAVLKRMDLDSYLRMLAAFTVMRNGDVIDEVYFSARGVSVEASAAFGCSGAAARATGHRDASGMVEDRLVRDGGAFSGCLDERPEMAKAQACVRDAGMRIGAVKFPRWAELAAAGRVPYVEPMAWDFVRIFSACHNGGAYATKDALIYCAESGLDVTISETPALRRRYVGWLRAILTSYLTTSAFAQVVFASALQLSALFNRSEDTISATFRGLKRQLTNKAPTSVADLFNRSGANLLSEFGKSRDHLRAALNERLGPRGK